MITENRKQAMRIEKQQTQKCQNDLKNAECGGIMLRSTIKLR